MRKKVRFIVNPFSGTKGKKGFPKVLAKYIDPEKFDYEITLTEYPRHAFELSQEAVEKGFDIVVAVGGDGSVNEVASALVNTKTMLGVLPQGSGNGFAGHFGLSRKLKRAIKQFNEAVPVKVDVCSYNDKYFFNVAGFGFDAKVAQELKDKKLRGFFPYAIGFIKNYFTYKATPITIELDGKKIEQNVFLAAFANGTQYGYGVKVAPPASVTDGVLDIIIVKSFYKILGLISLPKILAGWADKSWLVDVYRAKEISISSSEPLPFHIDGEPDSSDCHANIKIHSEALIMLAPEE